MYLNCHSWFSFKYGTISPEGLLKEAQQKGISALALTDINNTSGILDFFRLAKQYGVKPVAGIDFRNGVEQKFIALAKNISGFKEINEFLSHYLYTKELIPDRAPLFENTVVVYPFSSHYFPLSNNEFIGIKAGDLVRLNLSDWRRRQDKLVALVPVTFRNRVDFNAHRLLRAIDNNTLLSKLSVTEQAQPDEIMLSEAELKHIYSDCPQLLDNSTELLRECEVDFEFRKNKNLLYFTDCGINDKELLLQLCEQNFSYRYPTRDKKISDRYKKEIDVITEQGFTSYFLINWDIVQYAQRKSYFYVGRGSGANSMVAYLLKITDVDPIDLDLYFERFINPSRTSPPDFDIDFSSDERKDVIDYIFYRSPYGKKYKNQVALLATYSEMKDNAVTRELGKIFGLSKGDIDNLQKNKHIDAPDNILKLIFQYGNLLNSFPSHLSIHSGGILISEKSIYNYTATTMPPKGFPLVQFSMQEAEDVGLYKFDILAQRGLGKVRDAIEIIRRNTGEHIDIHQVEKFKEDADVRNNLETSNLMGCFYVESPAMRMLLTKLEAKTYLDLVAASSIIRPGVASSGMMREYILRFMKQPSTYETPKEIYNILTETFGVMVYQEDVIKVVHLFADLTFGEADILRRGMSGKYRSRDEFKKVEQKFFDNCKRKGHSDKVAKEVWRQIESFAGYSFSKGHSASYAVESYQCMYLKTHYPLEYMVAVINNGGGFYKTEFYLREAEKQGGAIHLPDMNKSGRLTSIEGNIIYLGFHFVKDLEAKLAFAIEEERNRNGDYQSLENFMRRIEISIDQLRILIRIGAFRFTGRTKKQLLWDIHIIIGANKKTATHKQLFEVSGKNFMLPVLHYGEFDNALDEKEILDFCLCSPFELLKDATNNISNPSSITINCSAELQNYEGKVISIVGYLVTYKSTGTKHGQTMAFGTFLDRDKSWIDTTHFPDVLKKYPILRRGCYLITGKVVTEFGFYSIDVTEMQFLKTVERD